MSYCQNCGTKMQQRVLADDHQPRWSCPECHYVRYDNPKILVSCFAYWQDQVLWMRRNTEPFKGQWAIPSGFMEENESLQAGAARELFEETKARVDIQHMQLYTVGSLVKMNQIYVVFRAPLLLDGGFTTTDEAMEVRLFSEEDFPWQDFAFPEVAINVRQFYQELKAGAFKVYTGILENDENRIREITSQP